MTTGKFFLFQYSQSFATCASYLCHYWKRVTWNNYVQAIELLPWLVMHNTFLFYLHLFVVGLTSCSIKLRLCPPNACSSTIITSITKKKKKQVCHSWNSQVITHFLCVFLWILHKHRNLYNRNLFILVALATSRLNLQFLHLAAIGQLKTGALNSSVLGNWWLTL